MIKQFVAAAAALFISTQAAAYCSPYLAPVDDMGNPMALPAEWHIIENGDTVTKSGVGTIMPTDVDEARHFTGFHGIAPGMGASKSWNNGVGELVHKAQEVCDFEVSQITNPETHELENVWHVSVENSAQSSSDGVAPRPGQQSEIRFGLQESTGMVSVYMRVFDPDTRQVVIEYFINSTQAMPTE